MPVDINIKRLVDLRDQDTFAVALKRGFESCTLSTSLTPWLPALRRLRFILRMGYDDSRNEWEENSNETIAVIESFLRQHVYNHESDSQDCSGTSSSMAQAN